MSRLIKRHQPCEMGCGSSDAMSVYDDGVWCFSCGKGRGTQQKNSLTDSDFHGSIPYSTKSIELKGCLIPMNDYRKLSTKTLLFYKCILSIKNDKNYISYPYSTLGGAKVRALESKEFFTEGNMKGPGLFGKDLFPAGGKALTITEGENDAMAVWQMNGGYPAVSVKSAGTAKADCQAEFEYINSFDKIYLAFDNDEPGQKALKEVASMFNPNKVYHVKLTKHKDAHAHLEADDVVLFNKVWWAAKPYLPAGIVGDYQSIEEILAQETAKPIATYPYKRLQEMTYGVRLGEVVLLTAPEKIGKTEVLRSLEYHFLKTTDYNMGIIHLEESEKRSVQGLVGYELKTPVHLPDSGVSNIESLRVWKDVTRRDNRCFLYKHFGSDDPDTILETIRYLVAACDCKFICLDHITMLVTGYQGDDERKKLDYLSTRLAMMTRELNFTLFLISHVNDDGKTRGSRNISKIADLIIHLGRDIEAASIEERNKTHLLIKGNRWAGLSGPSSVLWFDQASFTLSEVTLEGESERSLFEAKESQSDSYRPSSLWAEATPEEERKPTDGSVHDGLRPSDPPSSPEALGPEGMEGQRDTHAQA